MITLDLIQDSPEWHAHRSTHQNASDSPSMMGLSKYRSRSALMLMLKTGIAPEIDAFTQKIFNDGHTFEALARPLAEAIIGDDLYPVTGIQGKFSASFDGITLNEDLIFEHKTINASIRACKVADDLDDQYKIQMEHQLLVSDATKCLFMATAWESTDEVTEHFVVRIVNEVQITSYYLLIEQVNFWYESNADLRKSIVLGWNQLEKDLVDFVPAITEVKLVAAEVESFPMVSVQVKGEVVASNIDTIKPRFDKFLADVNTTPVTDQEITDSDASAKFSRATAKTCRIIAKQTVDQISSISDAVRFLETYADKFDAAALVQEKAVKLSKENAKLLLITQAQSAYALHIEAIRIDISPIIRVFSQPRFVEAIKGKQSTVNMIEALDLMLASAKIEADEIARDIRAKYKWFTENSIGFEFLFSDINNEIKFPMADLQSLVAVKIESYKQRQISDKAESERITSEINNAQINHTATAPVIATQSAPIATVQHFYGLKPEPIDIVFAVAKAFGASKEMALGWLIEADFNHINFKQAA